MMSWIFEVYFPQLLNPFFLMLWGESAGNKRLHSKTKRWSLCVWTLSSSWHDFIPSNIFISIQMSQSYVPQTVKLPLCEKPKWVWLECQLRLDITMQLFQFFIFSCMDLQSWTWKTSIVCLCVYWSCRYSSARTLSGSLLLSNWQCRHVQGNDLFFNNHCFPSRNSHGKREANDGARA